MNTTTPTVMSSQVNPSLIGKTILLFTVNTEGYIGLNGKAIWGNEHDDDRRKRLITGHTVVMGRKTWEANGKRPIPDCINIVLSKTMERPNFPNVFMARSLHEIDKCYAAHGQNLLYYIGGGSLFKQVIDKADILMMTQAEDATIGDTPLGFAIDQQQWKISSVLPVSRMKEEALKMTKVLDYIRSQFNNDLTAAHNNATMENWFYNRFLPMAAIKRQAAEKRTKNQQLFSDLWGMWYSSMEIPAPRRMPFNKGNDVAVNALMEVYRLQEGGDMADTFELLRMRLLGLTEFSKETIEIIHTAEKMVGEELANPENREKSHSYISLRRVEEVKAADEAVEPGIQIEPTPSESGHLVNKEYHEYLGTQ